jgi:hypothetical protein
VTQEKISGLGILKKVVGKLGAHFRAFRSRGGDPIRIFAVAEWADVAAWTKGQSDPELVALADGMRTNANPPWETMSITIIEEFPPKNALNMTF